jgi:SNF2 family DNA or RNA helicase
MIVFDEPVLLRNSKTRTYRACLAVARTCEHRKILTATPVSNSLYDLFGLFKICDEFWFGVKSQVFEDKYVCFGGFRGTQIIGYKNQEDMLGRVRLGGFVKNKEECQDLPPEIFEEIRVEMTSQQQELYDKLKEEFVVDIQKAKAMRSGIIEPEKDEKIQIVVQNALTRAMRLQQITSGHIRDENKNLIELQSGKLDSLRDFFGTLGNQKAVIWSRFVPDVFAIHKLATECGLQPAMFYGGLNEEKRTEEKNRFQEDENCRIFVSQVKSGGFSIDLTAASIVAFYANWWSYDVRRQAIDRVRRPGSEKYDKITIIDFICPDTIDEDVMGALNSKMSLANWLLK